MPEPVLFDEADLESERLGESDARCSYPPAQSEISELRHAHEPVSSDNRITLRAPAPSSALLELSGIEYVSAERDEPLRETRELFRLAVRDTWPESRLSTTPPTASPLRTVRPAPDVEEALRRAARSSFASMPPEPSDRQSGVRISAPHTIEEAVLRVIEAAEPMLDEIPKA
jgi:hypothetical protein